MKPFLFLICLFCASFSPFVAFAQITTTAKQAIIIDYETGMVLFEKNADQKMPTSSMSKVMSMYLVFEALQEGQIALQDRFTVSEKAWKKGGSKMFVEVGKQVKIEDLIRGVIVQSGNDATIVLAEGLAHDELAFSVALNEKAKALGMGDSHFMNASGWPDPDHYSTARDLSTLALAMIRNFPTYYGYYAEEAFTYNNIKQSNRNPLLYRDMGADGLKTGHTESGGYGLMGTAVQDGRRVVMVLNGMASKKERAQESARLLSWGLRAFRNITVFGEGQILDHAPVYLGVKKSVALQAQMPVNFTVLKSLAKDLKIELIYNAPFKAPIAKGDKLGVVHVFYPNGGILSGSIPLVAAEDVPVLGFFQKTIAKARLLITGQGHFE